MPFEWEPPKDLINRRKHGISFAEAQHAFAGPKRIIALDTLHSTKDERRFFCFGKVRGGGGTVRFTYRGGKIRLFGAGVWREGRQKYETETGI